jgi:hypothetical protein
VRYGIDCDGVIADFHKGFARVANKLWPGRIAPGDEYPSDWEWASRGFDPDEVIRVKEEIAKIPNWWCSLPAIGHNVGAIFRHRLRYPEDEIFYVTARRTDQVAGMPMMHQSQRWIDMCGIGGLGTAVIVMDGDNKVQLYKELAVDGAVDDDPNQVKLLSAGYLLSTPWNTDASQGKWRVKDLDEFFERVGRSK